MTAVVGVGELIVDNVFLFADETEVYDHTRGGGTIGNALLNASAAGAACTFVGPVADDWRAVLAVADLDSNAVAVTAFPTTKKLTRAISIRPSTLTPAIDGRVAMGSPMRTSGRCAVCDAAPRRHRLASLPATNEIADAAINRGAVVLFDRLGRNQADIAAAARARGLVTMVDLGHASYVRFQSPSRLGQYLRHFTLIAMPGSVARVLWRRLGVSGGEGLRDIGIESIVVVSEGAQGATLIDNRVSSPRPIHLPAPSMESRIVDSVGAGDAMFGFLAFRLAETQESRLLSDVSTDEIVEFLDESVAHTRNVLAARGARGHLGGHPTAPFSLDDLRVTAVDDLKACLADECPFCGSIERERDVARKARKVRPGARQAITLLEPRVAAAVSNSEAVDQCRDLLGRSETHVVLGTGGSYPVAMFVADMLTVFGKGFATAMRPYDYIRNPFYCDNMIGVSYSGSTPEIGVAMNVSVREGAVHRVLLTASEAPELASSLEGAFDTLISYSKPGSKPERGFLSIAATVAPCALWGAAVTSQAMVLDMLRELWVSDVESVAESLRGDVGLIDIIGGGHAWPAVVDLESKLTEANLAIPHVHESKDLSHGRFMSVLDASRDRFPVVILSVGGLTPYEERMRAELESRRAVTVLSSSSRGALGSLEVLMLVQTLVEALGREAGRDISRPKDIPKGGLDLYRWRLDGESRR